MKFTNLTRSLMVLLPMALTVGCGDAMKAQLGDSEGVGVSRGTCDKSSPVVNSAQFDSDRSTVLAANEEGFASVEALFQQALNQLNALETESLLTAIESRFKSTVDDISLKNALLRLYDVYGAHACELASTPTTTPSPTPRPTTTPSPTPRPTATPVPTPTATPLPCNSTVHKIFTYNSASTYKPYFADSPLTATQGRVLPVAATSGGYTAFFSCVTYPNSPTQSEFLIRTIAETYVPSTAPGSCTENLQSAMFRNGGGVMEYRSNFGNDTYNVAAGKTIAVKGSGGWILAMKCSSLGFVFTAVTQQ